VLVKDLTGCGRKKFSKFSFERMRPKIFDANAKTDKQPDAVLIVLSQKKGVGARASTPFLKREKV